MTDIRFYINLVESAQAGKLDEALSPLARNLIGGALSAGVAFGGMKSLDRYHDMQAMQQQQQAPAETPKTRPEAPKAALAPSSSVRPRARPDVTSPVSTGSDPDNSAVQTGGDAPETSLKPRPRPTTPQPATDAEKKQFVATLLPIIERQNQIILATRRNLEKLSKLEQMSPAQQAYVEKHMIAYRVKDRDFDTLLARLNVIPPSLVLAQSAIESGWGKSRLAKQGNALFGQKTTGDRSVDALEDGTRYAAFDDHADAVESYMRNLNSHPAYKSFRRARNHAVATDGYPSGKDLAQHLVAYSTKGEDYVKQVVSMIRKNGFDKHDAAISTQAVSR